MSFINKIEKHLLEWDLYNITWLYLFGMFLIMHVVLLSTSQSIFSIEIVKESFFYAISTIHCTSKSTLEQIGTGCFSHFSVANISLNSLSVSSRNFFDMNENSWLFSIIKGALNWNKKCPFPVSSLKYAAIMLPAKDHPFLIPWNKSRTVSWNGRSLILIAAKYFATTCSDILLASA